MKSDVELIEAWRRGDDGAFEELYRRHRDWVVTVAHRFCGHREDALDVLQETFLYVVKKLPTLVLTAKFTTFLYPAVKNLALTRRKKAKRFAALPPDAPEPFELVGLPDETRALLAGLSGMQREVVTLRFVDGLDLKDIAAALHVPLGTVKSRLHHALRILKGRVSGE